jgi:hypothetical protein
MARWQGRALGGRRLVARIPPGSYQTSTLIYGIRLDGPCAPGFFEGPKNGEMFLAWVVQGLAAALKTGDPLPMLTYVDCKFVVSGAGEAYDAQIRGPNRSFQI